MDGGKRPLEEGNAQPDAKRQATGPETVYRLVVPAKKVGAIIGKQGAIVKQIRDETNSRIRVCEGVPSCEDRVIVISAREEDPDAEENNAQIALMKVHEKLIEAEDPGSSQVMTRLLVCHTQAGCIIGKGGKIIKDIRESTGATIKILTENELPLCALHNDRVVVITGDNDSLIRALRAVNKQIRDNPSKERPGGAPPPLLVNIQGPPTPAATPPAYPGAPPVGYRPQYAR